MLSSFLSRSFSTDRIKKETEMVHDMERILRERFQPLLLKIDDDSARHAGHPGRQAHGGGHYKVRMVSPLFSGMGRLQRHRLVHEALKVLGPGRIHALALVVLAPEEWDGPDKTAEGKGA